MSEDNRVFLKKLELSLFLSLNVQVLAFTKKISFINTSL